MLERYQGKRYSVYNRRTGQPIYIFGTAPQCAAAMGVTVSSFFSLKARSQLRPSNKYEFFDDTDDPDLETVAAFIELTKNAYGGSTIRHLEEAYK